MMQPLVNQFACVDTVSREYYVTSISIIYYSLALFNHIGIDKYVIALSIGSSEGSFDITGAPSFPSYIPGKINLT